MNQDGPNFSKPIFQVFKTPTDLGHVDRNLWANVRAMQLVRFGCRRPADEAIQRSTFQLCEARPRDN